MLCHTGVCSIIYSTAPQSMCNRYTQLQNATKKKKKNLFIAVDNDPSVEETLHPSEAQFACWGFQAGMWHWNAHAGTGDEDRRRSTTKSTQTPADRHACTALSSWPGGRRGGLCTGMQVVYFQKRCMTRTIKSKNENVYCASTRYYLMLHVSFILIFCFLFFKCLWIYKYVLLMMCSGTKYSHGNFFIRRCF